AAGAQAGRRLRRRPGAAALGLGAPRLPGGQPRLLRQQALAGRALPGRPPRRRARRRPRPGGPRAGLRQRALLAGRGGPGRRHRARDGLQAAAAGAGAARGGRAAWGRPPAPHGHLRFRRAGAVPAGRLPAAARRARAAAQRAAAAARRAARGRRRVLEGAGLEARRAVPRVALAGRPRAGGRQPPDARVPPGTLRGALRGGAGGRQGPARAARLRWGGPGGVVP
ncbi:unnamed protein product, partial [Prorocentrum cordatum]